MEFESRDFATMMAASPYGIIVHDAHTKEILWANATTERLLGYTREELLPLKAHQMSGLADMYRRSHGLEWLQRAADEGIASIEWVYRAKNGEETLTEATATLVRLDSREVILVQFRDTELEQQTRRTLTRTEAMLTTLLAHMEEGILVVDSDGRITFASDSSEQLLGIAQHELYGVSILELCSPDSRATLSTALSMNQQSGRAQPVRFETISAENDVRWFTGSCQLVTDAGDLRGHLILFHDATERVLSDLQQERDLQHLNYLARFLAMGDMAKTIEHEIAQPIAAARNFLAGTRRRLETNPTDPTVAFAGIDNANAQLERAGVIMRSLREYVTRLEQPLQRVDLNELFSEVKQLLQSRAEQRSVRLDLALSDEPLPVWCERVLTGQVMLNLCFNAIEEMAEWPIEERVVRVETGPSGDGGVFRVIDTGKGLSHIPNGRVFDGAFTSKSSGHGIGLALSHQVIQRQHGSISARENSPRGAIFEFTLPGEKSADPLATEAIPVIGT